MTGRDIENLGQRIYDDPIQVEGVQLTFGTRHYFVCPHCRRRCEALFFIGRALCRKCARLGYHSQCHRPSSALGDICRLYTRRGWWRRVHGSRLANNRDKELMIKVFREMLEEHLLGQVEAVASAVEFGAEMERIRAR